VEFTQTLIASRPPSISSDEEFNAYLTEKEKGPALHSPSLCQDIKVTSIM